MCIVSFNPQNDPVSQPSEMSHMEVKVFVQDDNKQMVLLGLAQKLSGKNPPLFLEHYCASFLCQLNTQKQRWSGKNTWKDLGIRETTDTVLAGVSWTSGRAIGR